MARKHSHPCPIAAALNVLGDRWTLLIVREALYGATRFGEFQRNTGISKNLLADRLNQMVEDGLLERVDFADRGTTHAYRLTEKGRALETVFVALQQWADEFIYGEGKEPVKLLETETGKPLERLCMRGSQGQPIGFGDLRFEPGPGADWRTEKRLSQVKK